MVHIDVDVSMDHCTFALSTTYTTYIFYVQTGKFDLPPGKFFGSQWGEGLQVSDQVVPRLPSVKYHPALSK